MTSGDPKTPAPGAPSALGAIAAAAKTSRAGRGPAPVHLWNPPYCGDIGLEIRADGSWWYQGTVIARRPLVELFASVLRKDDDGRTYLVTPVEKIAVRVADAPFLAVEMVCEGMGPQRNVRLRTNFDDWVTVGRDHPLRFGLQPASGGLKPYVLVRGRLEALLVRTVYFELAEILEDGPSGGAGVWSGGVFWPAGSSIGGA